MSGLMSDLAICKCRKEHGRTWHRMSLQRPGVIEQHKFKLLLTETRCHWATQIQTPPYRDQVSLSNTNSNSSLQRPGVIEQHKFKLLLKRPGVIEQHKFKLLLTETRCHWAAQIQTPPYRDQVSLSNTNSNSSLQRPGVIEQHKFKLLLTETRCHWATQIQTPPYRDQVSLSNTNSNSNSVGGRSYCNP